MTYNAYFTRKTKPKKPDFEHNGKKFWIKSCNCVEMWFDGEYQDPLIGFDVCYFDTDKEVDWNEDVDDALIDKVYEKGKKLFPQAGSFQYD